jgi:hypothetical protein
LAVSVTATPKLTREVFSGGSRQSSGQCSKVDTRRVFTMCTPRASDWVGLGRTSAGLGRIGDVRGSGGFAGAGTRFESHLGHVFSLFRGLWASECAQAVHMGAPSGAFFVGGHCCGRVAPSTKNLMAGSLLLLHCRSRSGRHDRFRLWDLLCFAVAFPVGLHDVVGICSRPARRPKAPWHARAPRPVHPEN